MHIPDTMLHGAVCPVTAAVGAAGLGVALWSVTRSPERPSSMRFAGVTALVFSLQMLNFPVASGTSGHALGGVLAAALLGTPAAVLSMAIVLAVQALFFADGGTTALGANILNMGFVGAAGGGALLSFFRRRGLPGWMALTVASWLSVTAAAACCSLELVMSGTVSAVKVFPAMLGVHALIGVGEAVISGAVVALVSLAAVRGRGSWAVAVIALAAAALSPLASAAPDGLERVAGLLTFAEFPAASIVAPFRDYAVPGVSHAGLATVLAGLAGVVLAAVAGNLLARMAGFRR